MFKSLIISPPFGNVIEFHCATSVCGTYTLRQRNGMALRYLKTLRPVIKFGKLGWANSIGLRNPGLRNLNLPRSTRKILSLAILNQQDFAELYLILKEFMLIEEYGPAAIEINVSCPNAEVLLLSKEAINILQTLNLKIIIKIPPSKNHLSIIEYYHKCGVSYFHLFNSFPSKKGGVSGEVIKNYYLYLVHRASKVFGDSIKIIGGGGIQSANDILRYKEAGASFFSISTLFFHPIKLVKFFKDYENIKL